MSTFISAIGVLGAIVFGVIVLGIITLVLVEIGIWILRWL